MPKYPQGEKKGTKMHYIQAFVLYHLYYAIKMVNTKKVAFSIFGKIHATMAMDVLYSDLLKSIQVSPCIRDALGEGLNGILDPLRIREKICPAFRQKYYNQMSRPITMGLSELCEYINKAKGKQGK